MFHVGSLSAHPGLELIDHTEPIEGQVSTDWMTQDAVVPLSKLGNCFVYEVDNRRWKESQVFVSTFTARVGGKEHLLLQFKPCLGVNEVSVTVERLVNFSIC